MFYWRFFFIESAPNGDNNHAYETYIRKQEYETRENDSLSDFKRSRSKSLSSIRTDPLQSGNIDEIKHGNVFQNTCPSECDTDVNSRMETSDDESSSGK